jgi:hypothetical protein
MTAPKAEIGLAGSPASQVEVRTSSEARNLSDCAFQRFEHFFGCLRVFGCGGQFHTQEPFVLSFAKLLILLATEY